VQLSKTRKIGLAVAGLALPISGLAAAVLPSSTAHAAATGTGTLEICKNVTNGAVGGTSFSFTVEGVTNPVSVAPGSCSKGVSVAAGTPITVTENAQKGWKISGVSYTGGRATRSGNVITITVPKGSDQTLTVTNTGTYGFLKICKTTSAPTLVGDPFTFTENNTSTLYTAIANGACSKQTRWKVGSVIPIAEVGTSGTIVDSITSNGSISNINLGAQTVDATIVGGVTVVTYDNIPTPPSTAGYIEVCKNAADGYVNGHTFNFTVTGDGANTTVPVTAGSCSQQIEVPNAGTNGSVTVTEQEYAPFAVKSITGSSVLSSNTVNGSAIVAVHAGNPSTESIVTFTNETTLGLYKVCKIAGPGIAAGTPYWFTSTGQDSFVVYAGQCSQPMSAPLGSTVNVQEENPGANVALTAVSVSPASNDLGSSVSSGANFKVGPGITEADFTNTAFGTLKICKVAGDPSTVGQTFSFTAAGSSYSLTPSGVGLGGAACTPLISQPVGNVTVTENAKANFHLSNISVLPTTAAVSGSGSSETVAISQGGTTEVQFTNDVNLVPVELCLANSSILTLNGQTPTVQWYVNGIPLNGTDPSPSCTDGALIQVPAIGSTLTATAHITNSGTPSPGNNPLTAVFGTSDQLSGLSATGPYLGGNTQTAQQSFAVGPAGGNLTFTTTNS
jgi:hypothetical protein